MIINLLIFARYIFCGKEIINMPAKPKLTWAITNHQVCLWPLCMLGEMLTSRFHKVYGQNYPGEKIGEWRNRTNRWAVDEEGHNRLTRAILARALENPSWAWRITDKIPEACSRLLKFTNSVFQTDLSQKTNQEIWQLYQQHRQEFITMYTYAWFPNALEGLDGLLTQSLKKYLGEKLNQAGKVGKYLSILTTPAKDSVRRREEKEFLRLVNKTLRNKKARKLFGRELTQVELKLQQVAPTIDKSITDHWQKYCWLPFDYDGPAWDRQYFLARARKAIRKNINPTEKIRRWENEKGEVRRQQEKIAREIKLGENKDHAYLFKLARELMYLKDYRKDVLYRSYYHMDKLIREIGQRLSLSPTQVKHILPVEMEGALLQNKFDIAKLNRRIKYSVLVYRRGGCKIYTGAKARQIVKQEGQETKISPEIAQIRGETACPGQARGIVKLIFTVADLPKMNQGDILVSVATNPNLLPAMKKAGAIITDKGGITSHAAIISRELKTPCVTGTKIAAKVLKDGDRVKVKADQGAVIIIKQT